MSKKNITQINSNLELLNPIKPMNVDAVNYLGWFISDVQNVRNSKTFKTLKNFNASKFDLVVCMTILSLNEYINSLK